MRFRIIVEQDEDGIFVAECPTLPGCISQGKTRQEAIKNIKDAAKRCESIADKQAVEFAKYCEERQSYGFRYSYNELLSSFKQEFYQNK